MKFWNRFITRTVCMQEQRRCMQRYLQPNALELATRVHVR